MNGLKPFTQTFAPANVLMAARKERRAGETHESTMLAQGITSALKFKDRTVQAKVFKKVTGEEAEFGMEGADITIKFDDGSTFKGSPRQAQAFWGDYVSNNPQDFAGAFMNPEMAKRLGELMSEGGLSIQFGGGGEKKGSDFEKALKEHRRNVGPISSANFRQNHWLKQGQDPYERIEYSQYSEQYRQIQRELRKLRTDPRLSFEGDSLMKDSIREQIKDLEAEAAEKKALMDSLIPPKARKPLMKKLSDHDAQRFYFDAADELGKEATHEEIKKRARENAKRKNYKVD